MNVIFTIVVLLAAGAWALTIYNRLVRLRAEIRVEFKRLEASEQTDADGTRYNQLAASYNAALEAFPENIIAGLAGFRPAQMFVSSKP